MHIFKCLPTPVLLLGKSHGWRCLLGAIHGVAKSQTRLSDFTFTSHFHALEKEMATHSSVLAWRIPGTGEPGGLPSMGSHRVGHDWSDLEQHIYYWCIVALQIFRCRARWLSYTYTHILFFSLFSIIGISRDWQRDYSSQGYIVKLCWLLHIYF